MGLNKTITAKIKAAFNTKLKDAVKPFKGFREVDANSPSLDLEEYLANGTDTTAVVKYSGRGVFASYNASEIDGEQVLATDTKLLCLQAECSKPPMPDDKVNGMQVISVSEDPASVTWTLQLRGV